MIFKVEFGKAYDLVSWIFFLEPIEDHGFMSASFKEAIDFG